MLGYRIAVPGPINTLRRVKMTPESPKQTPSVAVSTPAATRTILIVDDDPSVTETFERMLRLEGYHVVTALSAEAGLNQAERSHPHAIILDLRMPLVDGLQFLRTLRSKDELSRMPVAIVTGDYFLDDAVSRELRGVSPLFLCSTPPQKKSSFLWSGRRGACRPPPWVFRGEAGAVRGRVPR